MNNAYSLVNRTPENGGRAAGPPPFLLLFLSFLFLFFLFSSSFLSMNYFFFSSFLSFPFLYFLFCSPLRIDHIFHLIEFFYSFFFILHFSDTWFPCVTFTFIPSSHVAQGLAMWHFPPTWHLIYGHDAMWHPPLVTFPFLYFASKYVKCRLSQNPM